MFWDLAAILEFVHLFLLLVTGWSQKSHPKDGPRKREAEERYF